MIEKFYIIIDKETDTIWSKGTKCAWLKSNHAISAWQLHMRKPAGEFHKQSQYVLKEITLETINNA